MANLPSLFLAHGAPDLILSDHVAKQFMCSIGEAIPKPRAILMISAHWEAAPATVTNAPAPETIHDFRGWPAQLYEMQYPARTDADLIEQTAKLLTDAGLDVARDDKRGFDHGVWVPLTLLYPDATIPVVQLSLMRGGDPAAHFAMGEALGSLRDEGVLILGSGATVHNLGALAAEGSPVPPWASAFDQWLLDQLDAHDLKTLLQFPAVPQAARQAHPTIEHFLPLYVAMGAGWRGGTHRRLHHSYSYGSIGMACYGFGSPAQLDLVAKDTTGHC
jgi:4,5-DOPA dioxygenase extradiol